MKAREVALPDRDETSSRVPMRDEIAAVVVLFEPDSEVVRRIDSYVGQVDTAIAIDNSEQPDDAIRAQLEARGVDYVPLGTNLGVASALNVACRRAAGLGYHWALTMDQDSTAPANFVAALGRCLEQPGSDRIAIVAPLPAMAGVIHPIAHAGCEELTVALTSGNLLRLSAFESVGGFRDDLFIDQVDHEFCMRAKRQGWRVVRQRDAIMSHRMGSRRQVTFPYRFFVSDYSPVRRYYMVRNTLELRREYGREFPDWLKGEHAFWRREFPKMILAEPNRIAKLRMMLRGWRDYRRRRFGPFAEGRR